jgi:hypothetical protein
MRSQIADDEWDDGAGSEPDRIQRRAIDGAQGWLSAGGDYHGVERHVSSEDLLDMALRFRSALGRLAVYSFRGATTLLTSGS